MATFLQGLDIQASGTRVELNVSGSIEAVSQLLRGTGSGPGS